MGAGAGAVQEGSVSSSNADEAAVLNSQQVGAMVLKALDGFLFVLNSDGEVPSSYSTQQALGHRGRDGVQVMYVSGNVGDYLGLGQAEILRKSVYSFLDHTNAEIFTKLLPDDMGEEPRPVQLGCGLSRGADLGLFGGGGGLGEGASVNGRKSQSFACGFRGRGGETVNLHVSAISLPYPPPEATHDFLSLAP